LLFELVRSHAAIDPTDIHARLSATRASAGIPAPSFLSINQALSELRQIHSEAALGAYEEVQDAAEPVLKSTLRALHSDEAGVSKALGRLLRSYKHAIDQARIDASERIESACAALLLEPGDATVIREISEAAAAWTSLCRPLLAWNAERPDRQLRLDAPTGPIRALVRMLCESRQFRAAVEVTAATREISAAVPTTLDQLAEDAHLFAAISAYTSIERLQKLIHEAEMDARFIAALETSGFGETSTGPAKRLWQSFVEATAASTSHETSPWRLVHEFAIRLSNQPEAAAAVVALITGLIRYGERTSLPPKMREELRDNLAFMRSFMGSERAATDKTPTQRSEKRIKSVALSARLANFLGRIAGHQRSLRDNHGGTTEVTIGLLAGFAVCAFAFYFGLDRLPFLDSSAAATGQAAASLGVQTMPPVGTGQHLALEGVRYCHYQQERLRFVKQWITAAEDARAYNLLIVDYNSRCSDFFYKDEDLKRVEAEVSAKKGLLEADARQIISNWPGHGSEVSSKD
jgi:hypothetical protein